MNIPKTALIPRLPPINHSFPVGMLNHAVEAIGVRLQWMQSSQCPCIYGGKIPGSPDRKCQSCFGKGIIWQNPGTIFTGLITYAMYGSRPPGYNNDPQWGALLQADPNLTIPYTSDTVAVWQGSSIYDAYIEVDATMRLFSVLTVGDIEVVPYQHSLTIAPTGAVTVYNTTTNQQEFVSSYVVNGPQVTISGYPEGTSYTVQFTASPVYVAYNKAGGMPHVRPFGDGINYPKRFKISLLDLWLRQQTQNSAI